MFVFKKLTKKDQKSVLLQDRSLIEEEGYLMKMKKRSSSIHLQEYSTSQKITIFSETAAQLLNISVLENIPTVLENVQK